MSISPLPPSAPPFLYPSTLTAVVQGGTLAVVDGTAFPPDDAESLTPGEQLYELINVTIKVVSGAACPTGHWCAGGKSYACPAGTYNPSERRQDPSACLPCDDNSKSPAGSAAPGDCLCLAGYYDMENATTAGPDCLACPVPGADCSGEGSTLSKMPLERGFWRVSNASISLRPCPDVKDEEGGEESTRSVCIGGDDVDRQCGNGTSGPLCTVCVRDDYYFDEDAAACVDCASQGTGLWIAGLTLPLVALAFAFMIWLLHYRERRSKRVHRMVITLLQLKNRLSLRAKLKALWSFYIVVSKLDTVYAITLPESIQEIFAAFPWLSSATGWQERKYRTLRAMSETSLVGPNSCHGFDSFLHELLLITLAPLASVVAILLLAVCRRLGMHAYKQHVRRQRRRRGHAPEHHEHEKSVADELRAATFDALPLVLLCTYAFSPIAYNAGFAAFVCDDFPQTPPLGSMPVPQPVASYLVADYRVSCASDDAQYEEIKRAGYGAIIVYAGVLPLFWTALLLLERPAVVDEMVEATRLSSAMGFMYADYRRGTFWWELVETGKKVILVGFLSLLRPGGSWQLLGAITVASAYLFLEAVAHPYRVVSDHVVALSCDFCLVITFVSCIVLQFRDFTTLLDASLDGRLDTRSAEAFAIDVDLASVVLACTLLFSLLLGMGMTLLQLWQAARASREAQAKARAASEARGRMSAPPHCQWALGKDKKYGCFLSHYKVEAGSDARYLSDLIRRMTGAPAYLDSTDLVDLRTLFHEGVHKSDVLLLLATKGVLTRPWCLMEIWEAAKDGVPVILFPVVGGGFDLDDARTLLADLEGEMPPRNPDCLAEVMAHVKRQGVTDVHEVEDVLLAHLGLLGVAERAPSGPPATRPCRGRAARRELWARPEG